MNRDFFRFRLLYLLLLQCFFFTTLSANTATQFKNRANLAIRQAGHYLLLSQCDSTSTIPAVEYYGEDGFLLVVNGFFDYNTLPTLLEQAFQDYNISERYELMVLACKSGIPLLGYNTEALLRGEIPCIGRDQVETCANIFVQFIREKKPIETEKVPVLAYLLIPIIGGLGFLFFKKNTPTTSPEKPKNYLELGQYHFDPKNQLLMNGDEKVNLTFRENKLLLFFVHHPNQVLNRTDILSAVWEDEGVIVGRSLDVFISRLRKRLKADPRVQIKNIHGVGYRLELPFI